MRRRPLKSPRAPDAQKTPDARPPDDALPDIPPTLVVLWSKDRGKTQSLRHAVESRLGEYVGIGMLRWLDLGLQAGEIGRDSIARECEALLSLDLWHEMVDRGYQTRLPEPSVPACLQLIVVVDALGEGSTAPVLDKLDKMLGDARQILGQRADLLPVLIWLGDRPSTLGQGIDKYWPRIRMDRIAVGGLEVSPVKIWEAVEHLIVALVTSDLVSVIDRVIEREVAEWLVVGVSALLVHPRSADYVLEVIIKEILEPLVQPVSEMDRSRLVAEAAKRAERVRKALVEEGVAALRETGWEAAASGLAIQECTLKDKVLLEAVFGPYQYAMSSEKVAWRQWLQQKVALIFALGKPFVPDARLGQRLQEHYKQVSETLEQWYSKQPRGLAPRILEEYRNLRAFLGAFLDRDLPVRTGSPEPFIWSENRPLPLGVPAALLAVLAMESSLAGDEDLEDARGLSPHTVQAMPTRDDAYLEAAAGSDADIVRGELQRYLHFARTLASPWGVLLNLLPAWFVAALVLQSILHWPETKSLTVSGLALLVLGIGGTAYWWLLRAQRLFRFYQLQSLRYLGTRVLSLMGTALREYRYWLLHRLRESETILTDLYASLLRRYRQSEEALRAWDIRQVAFRQSSLVLFSEKEAEEWKKQAMEKVSDHLLGDLEKTRQISPTEAVAVRITRQVWPLSETPMPSSAFVDGLDAACQEVVRAIAIARQDRWRASVIAEEEVDFLKEGKRWKWLWQQAHPLADIAAETSSFTVILAPREFLLGSTGKARWSPEWITGSCRQANEEMCIRVIVEGKRGD